MGFQVFLSHRFLFSRWKTMFVFKKLAQLLGKGVEKIIEIIEFQKRFETSSRLKIVKNRYICMAGFRPLLRRFFGRPMSTVTIFSECVDKFVSDERQRNEKQRCDRILHRKMTLPNFAPERAIYSSWGHSVFYKGIQVVFVSRQLLTNHKVARDKLFIHFVEGKW